MLFFASLIMVGASIVATASTDFDPIDFIKTYGIGLGIMMFVLWLILKGKLHTDSEFQREVYRADRLEEKLDRIITVQEEITDTVKEAISKRAEISSIDDLVKLADYARNQGLIK